MKITRTYKFRLRPSVEQAQTFWQWIGVCRLVYNMAKEVREQTYQKSGKTISAYDLNKQLREAKPEADWLKGVHSQVLQNAVFRLDRSYKNFFEGRAGYPKWATRHRYNSFTFPQSVRIEKGRLKLPKIGLVKLILHREVAGEILTAIILRNASGWYACLSCEVDQYPYKPMSETVGIDSGIAQSYTRSDGEVFQSPDLSGWQRKLKIVQRKLARQQKGSNRREKTKHRISRLHEKIRNIRTDFLHQTSTTLIRENQAVFVEDLKIGNMSRSAKGTLEEPGKRVAQKSGLNREILNQSWGRFFHMLEYKARWYGREFGRVPPNHTSQTYGQCGHISADNRKTQSQFACVKCGCTANADVNAAQNILRLGLSLRALTYPVGESVVREAPAIQAGE